MAANTLIPVPPWTFPVRIAQFVISFLVLIFTIIPIALWAGYYSFGLGIFTCIATGAITGYWYYANKRDQTAYNRWAILFLDCWAVLWWLISFATLAELAAAFATIAGFETIPGYTLPGNIKTSRALTSLAAFLGAVEFVLFIITLVTFAIRLHSQRREEIPPMQNANSNLRAYPNNQTFPSDQTYPSNQTYPGNQTYPSNQAYTSNQTYPSDQTYPSNQTYSSNQTYLNNGNMGPGAKDGSYVSSQPVRNFTHV